MNIFEQLDWLKDHPEFREVPASIEEFLGEEYLNIRSGVRPSVLNELKEIFGTEVNPFRLAVVKWAIFTGAIGIGKTTVASIVLPYMVHWCLCLTDPQGYFNLLPGSRIAFMMMSTSERQAREVLFADIDARIKYSPWFQSKYAPPHPRAGEKIYETDKTYKNQIRFTEKDIWIVPGDSTETTFEGYNILGGVIDEADSHKVTDEKDYASDGFDTIDGRIASRFQDRGLLLVIGQMKKANGFAAKKYREFKQSPHAYAAKLTIWESFGWEKYLKLDGTRDSFWYDIKRKTIVPSLLAAELPNSESLIEIPTLFRPQFENNPEKSLRDLAGIPPAVGDPFISLVDRLEACRDKWKENYHELSPIKPDVLAPRWHDWFICNDPLKRALHVDLAYSGDGDACGIAMGHVRKVVDIDNELKPYIVFDMLARIHAASGTEIQLSDIRQFIYTLRDELRFKIKTVTIDGFESTDTMQQLRKKKFFVDYLSVDKSLLPYMDLREAIYEGRVEFPEYITHWRRGDTAKVEIAIKELMELEDTGKKIDHPEGGSKDVADAMAGVVSTLMGDRSFRRGKINMGKLLDPDNQTSNGQDTGRYGGIGVRPGVMVGGGMSAPIPPSQLELPGSLLPFRQ